MSAAQRDCQSGSLLVITLWLVTILSILAVAIARYLSTEVRLTKYRLAREQAQALARSGVYLAMQQLERDAQDTSESYESYDWLGDDWALPQEPIKTNAGELTIAITDEERKLNVNVATWPALEQLLGDPELATAVIDYVDADEEPPQEAPPYTPKNSQVIALEELFDIPGAGEAAHTLSQWLTASTDASTPLALNINTVEQKVLIALGGSDAVVNPLIASRPGPNGQYGDDDDCKAITAVDAANDLAGCAFGVAPGTGPAPTDLVSLVSQAPLVSSSTFRIQSEAVMSPSKVRYRVVAIVKRSADPATPSTIVSWREG